MLSLKCHHGWFQFLPFDWLFCIGFFSIVCIAWTVSTQLVLLAQTCKHKYYLIQCRLVKGDRHHMVSSALCWIYEPASMPETKRVRCIYTLEVLCVKDTMSSAADHDKETYCSIIKFALKQDDLHHDNEPKSKLHNYDGYCGISFYHRTSNLVTTKNILYPDYWHLHRAS